MRTAFEIEQSVGIGYFVSDADGTGGRLRDSPADFRVTEVEQFETHPLDGDPGSYPHVVIRVTLRQWDTNAFAGRLSDRLGISRERISWAGTKDKHAITTQLLSIDGIDPEDIPTIDGADIELVGRAGRPILFGDLAGNEFEIVVRDPDKPGQVKPITSGLQEFVAENPNGPVGVPNYFGHQRFGSRRPATHEVGLAIARNDWEGAVLSYVGNPSPREPESTQAARRYVEDTHDWQGALDRVPTHLGYERAMLHELAAADTVDEAAFRQALEAVPSNLQRLFVHAAQSYIFNRILTARLEAGHSFVRPVVGDVVCFGVEDAPAGIDLPAPDRTQRVTAERLETIRRHCERGRAYITAPLVGTETELGTGEPGELEAGVLDATGIEPSDFALPGEFESTGTRRAIACRTDISVQVEPLRLNFALPKGSYATVMCREYLKTDPQNL